MRRVGSDALASAFLVFWQHFQGTDYDAAWSFAISFPANVLYVVVSFSFAVTDSLA